MNNIYNNIYINLINNWFKKQKRIKTVLTNTHIYKYLRISQTTLPFIRVLKLISIN